MNMIYSGKSPERISPPTPPPYGNPEEMNSVQNSSAGSSERAEQGGGAVEKAESTSGDAPENASEESVEVQSAAMRQLQALRDRLASDTVRLARRFRLMILFFLIGAVILSVVLKQIHYYTVGRYAVLSDVVLAQHPCNQGQLEISYNVVSPGRVYLRRTSGVLMTDLIYDYSQVCKNERQHWNWNYVPGQSIDVELWSRSGVAQSHKTFTFPTSDIVDIVVLIDTTESMDASIQALKEKCVDFAASLRNQKVRPRFSLISFGDSTVGGNWIQETEFTEDELSFQDAVENIARFQGGDLPESALDALEAAIVRIGKNPEKHAVRFYLVTDQAFHPQTTESKLDAAALAQKLSESGVMLEVFARPRFKDDFLPLIGDCGHFREIENFGEVLMKGRFLED